MKTLTITIAILICSVFSLKSQTYLFQTFNATYTELVNPISLNNNDIWEMPDYIIPIGFNFQYFNSVVDSLFFFQDGSSSTLSSSIEEGGIHKLFIPFGAALVDRGYGTSVSQSPLSYKLIGLPGNRVLKIEWKNAGLYGELQFNGTTSDFINFQMWLYEISGDIEIHYGPSLFNYPQFDFTFESGPAISLIPSYDWDQDIFSPNSIWLVGNPDNPEMISSENIYFLGGTIEPNTIYKFHNLLVESVNKEVHAPVVYPNPVINRLNLRLRNAITSPTTIIICDMTGRTVYNSSTSPNQEGEIQIPVSNLNTGIYQLIIKQGKETYTSRFFRL